MSPDIRSNRPSERLLQRLDRIEERRDTLLGELDALDEEDLARRPEAEVWSVNEVVEHMVQAERYVLRALFDEGAGKDRPRTLRNRVLHRIVIWILKGPIPVKVPVRGMDPTGERPLAELVPEWRETHHLLREWLETRAPADLEAACFMHPVAGPLTAANAVEMLGTHFDRHAAQIRSRIGRG